MKSTCFRGNKASFVQKSRFIALTLIVFWTLLAGLPAVQAQPPNFIWVRQIMADFVNDLSGMALDGAGNCLVVGSLSKTNFVFPGAVLTNNVVAGAFLAKYDAKGNLLWVRQPTVPSNISHYVGVAADNSGACYVSGSYFGTNILGGSTSPGTCAFLAKYDSAGNPLWVRQAGGVIKDQAFSVSVDGGGNSYFAGVFQSPTLQFGSTVLTNMNTNTETMFLVKLDGMGEVIWARQASPVTEGYGRLPMSVDSQGNVLLTGKFWGYTASFGNIQVTNNNGATNSSNIFIAKYDSSGNVLWAKCASENSPISDSAPLGLAVDKAGNTHIIGVFTSTNLVLGGVELVNPAAASAYVRRIFIAKYDSQGNLLWAKQDGVQQHSTLGYGIAVDAAGNDYTTGYSLATDISFDGTYLPNTNGLNSLGFVVKRDPVGQVLWAKPFVSGGYALAADPLGRIFVGGVSGDAKGKFDTLWITNSPNGMNLFVAMIEGPQLSLTPLSSQFAISWPTNAVGLHLESASIVGGPWLPVTNAPALSDEKNSVRLDTSSGSQFFRLNGP